MQLSSTGFETPPGWSYPAPPRRRDADGLATASLVLGVVAMVLNVLLVPTALAVVLGSLALGRGTRARTRAVVGIALGGAGVLALGVQIAVAIPLVMAALGLGHHVPYHERMAAWIQQDLDTDGWVVRDVQCPAAGSFFPGKRITCTAYREGVGDIRIDVTFTDTDGAYRYVTDSTQPGT